MSALNAAGRRCVKHALTITDCPPGDLPQDEAQGPDIHPLVGLEAVRLDGVVEHLGGHVALCSHFRVVPHVQLVRVLEMHDRQTLNEQKEHFSYRNEPPERGYYWLF